MTIELNRDSFENEVLAAKELVLIDFWGPQCVPCLALAPGVETIAEKYADRIKVVKVEAPKNRRLCLNLKVLSLPTFLTYKDGKEVERLSGDRVSLQMIEDSIKRLL